MKHFLLAVLIGVGTLLPMAADAAEIPTVWVQEFPKTDFATSSVDFAEIFSGGPPRDGIPAIDAPTFAPLARIETLADTEPVIGLVINGVAKAYPLRIMMWHEIVNDEIAGVPVTVTYCPLCNSAVVFDRRIDGRLLDFGTTGRLRFSDLVMYDRQTESWWQQFLGEAIIGELTGTQLKTLPARLESFAAFKQRAPDGMVLVPNGRHARDYGRNPYEYYDSRTQPYAFFDSPLPTDINPMARVIVVDGQAWAMTLLRDKGTIQDQGLTLTWTPGQNSALDSGDISKGRDVGNVTVTKDGQDTPYDITFAFAYKAFYAEGVVRVE
tara:strand:+ start:1937 stop:2908 length:972 start_codon:yes stop_codon:yes gene_type:complete